MDNSETQVTLGKRHRTDKQNKEHNTENFKEEHQGRHKTKTDDRKPKPKTGVNPGSRLTFSNYISL